MASQEFILAKSSIAISSAEIYIGFLKTSYITKDPSQAIIVRELSPDDIVIPKELWKETLEALEMGAFHHSACPWNNGKECCCAREKIDRVLPKLQAHEAKKLEKAINR